MRSLWIMLGVVIGLSLGVVSAQSPIPPFNNPTFTGTVKFPDGSTWTVKGATLTGSLTAPILTGTQAVTTTIGTPLTLPGDHVLAKTVRSSVGPGFGAVTVRARPGSKIGTCKLVAVAGNSTVETTILDNIGSGC